MFTLSSSHRFHLYSEPTDMRKSFDGLSGLVRSYLKRDPIDGSAYVFMNNSRNRIKILLCEGDGFSLYYRRLEKGTIDHPIVTREGDNYSIIYDLIAMIYRDLKENTPGN